MGRVKVEMKKIENKTYRNITFAKRRNGLLKKAYEISTLCDIELALFVFSPAGNLTLFNGKKRLDQILMQFMDHTQHHREERLRDQEFVSRMIAQLSLEAELCHRQASNTRSIDSQLQEIKKEICKTSAELEAVEKQLQYFYKSPSCIKSAGEAEFIEGILKETLKLVSIHKRDMEANNKIKLKNSEKLQIHPQSESIMGRLCNWPHQQYEDDSKKFQPASHFPNSAHSQSLRNEPTLSVAEVHPFSLLSPFDKFFNNAHFSPSIMNTIHKGKEKKNPDNEQNKFADATAAQDRDCGLHFSVLTPNESTGSSDSSSETS